MVRVPRLRTVVVLLAMLGVVAGAVSTSGKSHRSGRAAAPRAPAGERLRYHATWNGVPVATAELLVASASGGTVQLKGRAETNEALDLLWRMRDSFEATVARDPGIETDGGIRPDRFLLRQHENERRRETTVTRDAAHGRLVGSKCKPKHPPRVASVPLGRRVHDPASLGYLLRTLPPELATPQTYEVFTGTKTYRLTVTPAGEEKVEAIGRRWPARKLRLSLELVPTDEKPSAAEGAVQNAELWVSSGPERLPLRLQSETFWGWVSVELIGRGARGTEIAAADR